MAAQDKTVKILVQVDGPAAEKAKQAIISIKQQVDDLVKSVEKLGGFLGGGLRVGTQAGRPGTSAGTQATHAGAGGGGGIVGNVSGAMAGGANKAAAEIKKTADVTKASFKSIQTDFKALVDSQEREVRRIETVWGRLKRAMGMGPGGGAGIGGPAGAVAGGGGGVGVSNPPAAATAGGGGGGAKKPGGSGPQGFLAGVAQQFGLPVGLVGGGAAVAAGVGMAKTAIAGSFGNQMANVDYALESPYGRFDARGTIGSIMGGNAAAIRHGDMARLHAMKALSSDPAVKQLLGQDDILEFRRMKQHPTGALDSFVAGKTGAYLKGKIGDVTGQSLAGSQIGGPPSKFEKFMNKVMHPVRGDSINAGLERDYQAAAAGGSVIGNENQQVIEQNLARQKEFALQAERQQRLLEAKMREDPMFNERINTVYGRSGSDTSLMRGLGMSGRDRVFKGADISGTTPKDVRFNAPALIRAKAESQGRDVGEFTAAFSQLAGFGRGFGGRYDSILSPMTGGLHNAAAIQGIGAQYGKFGALLGRGGRSGIQGMIGRGGVDVTAGMQMTNLGLQSMQSAQFLGGMAGTGGSGLMETLLTATASGAGPGGDMLNARIVSMGMGRREQEAAGSVDQLNKALNMKAAMQASPEAPWSIRNAITSLSEGQLLDIIKDPKNMPKALLDNGVTSDMIQKYWAAKNATSMARFGGAAEYGTAEQRSVVAQYRKAGGLGFLKGKSAEEVSKALNVLSVARAAGGGTINEHLGSFRAEAAALGVLGKPKGGGAGDPFSKGSATAAANAAKGDLSSNEARVMGNEGEVYKGDYGHALQAQLKADKEREKAQAGFQSGANAGQAIMGVTKALDSFVKALKEMVSDQTAGKAGAKRAGP